MIPDQVTTEQMALNQMQSHWAKQGYRVLREPNPSDLPDFLHNIRLDAIAIGRMPSLAIEVVNGQSSSASTRVRQLQNVFQGRKDWRLELVYVGADTLPIGRAMPADIERALEQALRVMEMEPRAALLLAWAALEAAARTLRQDGKDRPMSPSLLIDFLVSQGHLSQEEGASLRDHAAMRSRVAHGELDLQPSPAMVRDLVEIARSLALEREH